MDNSKTFKTPSFGYSAFVLIALAASTFSGMKLFGASLNVVMFLNWLLMTALAAPLGTSYNHLEKKKAQRIGILTALFIIFAIGGLTGTWMASGTVPAIIYHGMNIMSAKFFLPTSLLLCSVVSVATGTSWGTLGTMGVALIGIGAGLGIPAGMTAGAAICGAWFGDKISPLSDTTNFTAAIVGAPLSTHIKHMMYTTGPSYAVTLALFSVLGLRISQSSVLGLIDPGKEGIASTFKLGLPVLFPIIVVLVLLLMRKNPTMALLAGSLTGILVAIFYQGSPSAAAFNCLYNGFNREFDNSFLTSLLNRGGITSMLSTSMNIIFCVGIGSMMKKWSYPRIVKQLAKLIRSTGSLVDMEIIGYISQMLSAPYFADVMLQSTMLDIYKEKRLKPENLSRLMEDCNTIGGTMIPWSSTALYIVGTIGVSFTEYLPYIFLCYLTPLMGLICGFTGWGIAHYKDDEIIP
ncbi:MAG: Na+/H+ antiporter NhaC family protein, partial [Eisenbergiella sp.]